MTPGWLRFFSERSCRRQPSAEYTQSWGVAVTLARDVSEMPVEMPVCLRLGGELSQRFDALAESLDPARLCPQPQETIDQVRSSVNPGLEIEGLLRTMYDSRNNLSGAVSEQLTEHFGERVYRTLIPRNVTVAEAPSYGLPVLRYAPASKGALAYLGLAGELLRRNRKRQAG